MPLLATDQLNVKFQGAGGAATRAVRGVSVRLERAETVGLVGESGCGKTTLALAMLGLVPAESGAVLFEGKDIAGFSAGAMRRFRRNVQIIFQDPYGSLNPRMTVGAALEEPLIVHGIGDAGMRRAKALEMLRTVGLDAAHASRYPHEFSGGQRQRIGIARALMLEPALLMADEPVSALDVSVQAQVLNLLRDLCKERALALFFIAHDLAVVRYMCDRLYVMYLGRILESAESTVFFRRPLHPYSQALLAAVPDIDKALSSAGPAAGNAPAGAAGEPQCGSQGCPFLPRCPKAARKCSESEPTLREIAAGHAAACHFAETP